MQLVKHLEANDRGRDFVVGDLHGCRQDLQFLLESVSFDPNRDRLISTGDLIDRGPDSPGCLALLDEPWFEAVAGNHELMFMDYLKAIDTPTQFESANAIGLYVHNGGEWAMEAPHCYVKRIPEFLETLQNLPMILSIDTPEGGVWHVTHGDLMLDGKKVLTDRDIEALSGISNPDEVVFQGLTTEEIMLQCVWSRRLISSRESFQNQPEADGLSRVYVGHTIQNTPKLIASHCYIDGGAFVRYRHSGKNGYGLNLIDQTHQVRYWLNGDVVTKTSLDQLHH